MQQTQQVKIRVLVGDTSVRSRLVLSGMIDAEPLLEVVDTAQSREELLYKAISTQPDLIVTHYGLTMSGKLPAFRHVYGGSSLLLLASQNLVNPGFSSPRQFDVFGHQAIPATQANAFLPEGGKSGLMSKLREFVGKYTMALPHGVIKHKERVEEKFSRLRYSYEPELPMQDAPVSFIVLGASTGGSTAIEYLVRELPAKQPAVLLVAVHMPEKFTKRLAQRLQKLTTWQVVEGAQGMVLGPQSIVIAPGGQNMRVIANALRPHRFTLELEPSNMPDSPSVDVLMASAAQCAEDKVLGVILTGMGQDGTAGAKEIIKQGGIVIAQDEATSSIYGMAKAAVENDAVHGVFALGQINSIMNRFVADRNRSHMLQRIAIG